MRAGAWSLIATSWQEIWWRFFAPLVDMANSAEIDLDQRA